MARVRRALWIGAAVLAPLGLSLSCGREAVSPAIAAPTSGSSPCARGLVHAVIGGRHRCLKPGRPCARRLDRQYHRYRFHCHAGRLKRLTVAETIWVARVGAWARGLAEDTRDALDFLPDWLAQRDADSLSQLREFTRVLGGCRVQLAGFGGPPTRRFRAARSLFVTACSRFGSAADLYSRVATEPDPALVARAAAEVDAGLTALDRGLVELARQPR